MASNDPKAKPLEYWVQSNPENYSSIRAEREKSEARNRLSEAIKKKIKTTMIGAISSIEEKLSFLWQENPEMFTLYQELRSEILDKGNNQVRTIDSELSQYEISSNKFYFNIPIKKIRKD